MTPTTNARVAGFTFLLYIVAGLFSMFLFNLATRGAEGTAATLAAIARNETLVRLTAVLALLMFVYAVVLGVTLHALTRDQDRDLALFAMCCRVAEGVIAAMSATRTLNLLSVAEAAKGATGADLAAVHALGAQMLAGGWQGSIASACFAIGSTIFACLFLRARTVPAPLTWLGLAASVLLVAAIPYQLAGFFRGPATFYVWMPMLAFELALAAWLIVKGVGPAPASSRRALPMREELAPATWSA